MLIVSPGNGFGYFGHVAIRYGGRVGHFCLSGKYMTVETMDANDYLMLYTEYEQRDLYGIEIELPVGEPEKIMEILEAHSEQPFSPRPYYHSLSNNCTHGAWYLLVRRLSQKPDECKLPNPLPSGLANWVRSNFKVRSERFYPSYRHRKMIEKIAKGEGVASDMFVPSSNTNTHRHIYWRFVYTEDLDGALFILRPVGGAANVATGLVQMGCGVVGIPFGRFPDTAKGFISSLLALPELLFVPARRAGRIAPYDNEELQKVIDTWQPVHERKKGADETPAPSNDDNEDDKPVRPPSPLPSFLPESR